MLNLSASNSKSPRHSKTRSAVAALAIAVFATSAFAQVRQIPQGHALDANPQVGSGGSNTPVQGYTPINGNNIIDGNVKGLSYFHGRVGTSSPNTFQGPLGSAALQDFDRQSAGGVPTNSGGYIGQPYFQSSTIVSGQGGALYSSPTLGGTSNSLIPSQSYNPAGNPRISQSLIGENSGVINLAPSPAAVEQGPDTAGAVLNSSLFIRQQGALPIQTPENTQQNNPQQNRIETPNTPQTPDSTKQNNDNNNNNNGQTIADNNSGRTRTQQLPNDRVKGNVGSQLVNGNSETKTGAPTSLGSEARISDTYRTLLSQLQEAQANAKKNPAETTPPGTIPPKTLAKSRYPHNSILDEPVTTLQAGRNIKPLTTLANIPSGGVATPFDEQMKQGEDQMKAGKFLDAVDTYQQALITQPENALANLGRAQAELAAGMYESAAIDLKTAFTRKPELISVRYDLSNVLPARRLDNLFADLLSLTTEEKSANTASFLYCYLAYNTNHPRELQDELGRWGIRPAHDDWQTVAAKAWAK